MYAWELAPSEQLLDEPQVLEVQQQLVTDPSGLRAGGRLLLHVLEDPPRGPIQGRGLESLRERPHAGLEIGGRHELVGGRKDIDQLPSAIRLRMSRDDLLHEGGTRSGHPDDEYGLVRV